MKIFSLLTVLLQVNKEEQGGIGVADDESEVLAAYRMPTIIPVYDEFGSFASTKAAGFNNPRNPVRRLTRNNGSDTNFNGKWIWKYICDD